MIFSLIVHTIIFALFGLEWLLAAIAMDVMLGTAIYLLAWRRLRKRQAEAAKAFEQELRRHGITHLTRH